MNHILTVTDLDGQSYVAISNIPRIQAINGEREITLSFLRNDINDVFLKDIETGWTVEFKGDKYHLFNEQEDKHGNKRFDGVLDFFRHFNGIWHVDEADDQSMTIDASIPPLFQDSYYHLQIIDNFYANTMNYSKQQNSTERFLYFIGRHNAEFHIPIGTQTVQIRNRIGVRRNDIMIHEDDNLVDFNIDTDTSSFCTAIKYYYDFRSTGDESNEKEPQQSDVYISPMADKYGVYYGQPVYDERFSVKANAREAAKQKQEGTWESSFEISAELFRDDAGNIIHLGIGDEVRFIVPSKGINGYIRVVQINEEFDEYGDLIAVSYVFGNENIASQYRKMQYDAIQDVRDILNGQKPIPFSVMPKAIREATNIIHAGDTTQFYYRPDGIYGVNTENPLWMTRHNANGIGFSQDGGQTFPNAITHLGVVTEALTAGTIDANRITIYGSNGTNRIRIDGDEIRVWDSADPEVYTTITKGRIHANRGALSVTRSDAYTDSSGKEWGVYMQNGMPQGDVDVQRNQFIDTTAVRWAANAYELFGGEEGGKPDTAYNCESLYTSHKSRFMRLGLGLRLRGSSSTYATVEVVEISTGTVMAEMTKFIREEDERVWDNLTFELGVPDYSTEIAYYVRLRSSILSENTRVSLRINRVSMRG